jgi:hypothetical protein
MGHAYSLGVLRAGIALVLAATALAAPGPAAAETAAFSSAPDALTILKHSGELGIDVVANDMNPTGEPITYCGTYAPQVDGPPPAGTAGGVAPDGLLILAGGFGEEVHVSASRALARGTYVVTYAVCTHSDLIGWGDLTITVEASVTSALRVERGRRPGRVKIVNRHDEPLRFAWGAYAHQRADGAVIVPPHASTWVLVDRPSVLYVAVLALGFHAGGLRHLRLPRRGPHHAEGLPANHSVSYAAVASCWSRQELHAFLYGETLDESAWPPKLRCR